MAIVSLAVNEEQGWLCAAVFFSHTGDWTITFFVRIICLDLNVYSRWIEIPETIGVE